MLSQVHFAGWMPRSRPRSRPAGRTRPSPSDAARRSRAPACSARPRRPACSCARAPCGSSRWDRGTSPARSISACRRWARRPRGSSRARPRRAASVVRPRGSRSAAPRPRQSHLRSCRSYLPPATPAQEVDDTADQTSRWRSADTAMPAGSSVSLSANPPAAAKRRLLVYTIQCNRGVAIGWNDRAFDKPCRPPVKRREEPSLASRRQRMRAANRFDESSAAASGRTTVSRHPQRIRRLG